MRPKQKSFSLSYRDYISYLLNKQPPVARLIHDACLKDFLFKHAYGRCIEVGAGARSYASFTDQQVVNAYYACDKSHGEAIDASCLPFEDCSFDTVICLSALEHFCDASKAIDEFRRILKNDGHLIIATPWLFPYHMAPDDYYRWSFSGLQTLLKPSYFEILEIKAAGNFFASIATFLQRPSWSRHFSVNLFTPLSSFVLRLLGLIFLFIGSSLSIDSEDDNYALLYIVVARNTFGLDGRCQER